SKMANRVSTHGTCSHTARLAPTRPAATPSAVYTSDMPSTNTAASDTLRQRDAGVVALADWLPARMASRMGTMGSTQGVKDSSTPKAALSRMTCHQPADAR